MCGAPLSVELMLFVGSRGERFLLTVGRFQTASGELLKQNLVCSNPNGIISFSLSLSLPPFSVSIFTNYHNRKREYFNHAVFHNFCNIWYK